MGFHYATCLRTGRQPTTLAASTPIRTSRPWPRALAGTGVGRICLFGPPGTGKTAWAHWLAGRLDRSLTVRRASDLLSKYIGESEQHIARLFRQARQENSLLLLDEVDSFLRERRGARQGWEVSPVNEMLTQMETFPGIFIASTNLMEGLDAAALRRFDLKIQFSPLRPGQTWSLLKKYCAGLDLARPPATLRRRTDALDALTPGDFAAVSRCARLMSFPSPAAFVEKLEQECSFKQRAPARIGFL